MRTRVGGRRAPASTMTSTVAAANAPIDPCPVRGTDDAGLGDGAGDDGGRSHALMVARPAGRVKVATTSTALAVPPPSRARSGDAAHARGGGGAVAAVVVAGSACVVLRDAPRGTAHTTRSLRSSVSCA